MSEEEQVLLGLIRRCDTKIASHIGVMITITFGSFIILEFLQGAMAKLATWNVEYWYLWWLLVVDIVILPFFIFYCLSRATHYSQMAEILKGESARLTNLENMAFRRAMNVMPQLIRKLILRLREITNPSSLLITGILFYLLWLVIVIAVLMLP